MNQIVYTVSGLSVQRGEIKKDGKSVYEPSSVHVLLEETDGKGTASFDIPYSSPHIQNFYIGRTLVINI